MSDTAPTMGRNAFFFFGRSAMIAALCVFSGCAGSPGVTSKSAATAKGDPVRPPFTYRSLNVRNSCFVESVHFYDLYRGEQRNGPLGWVRVLQWGHQDGDFKINTGHAVAVCTMGDRIWTYDVNFGFSPLATPVRRVADITDVAPEVYARYPQYKPVFGRYREDFLQPRPEKVPEFLFYHMNPDVRDATKVASELGRYRPVRVIEFDLPADGKMQTSAGAVFVFGNRLCTYLPAVGTHITRVFITNPDDLAIATQIIRRTRPGAVNVRWQPGGYWFYPPKT